MNRVDAFADCVRTFSYYAKLNKKEDDKQLRELHEIAENEDVEDVYRKAVKCGILDRLNDELVGRELVGYGVEH